MDLSRVIIGPVVTEKAERLKTGRTFTVRIAPKATKIDVKNALRQHFDVEAAQVRSIRVRPKVRAVRGKGNAEKRPPSKKVLVTLTKDSKTLDLSSFRTT